MIYDYMSKKIRKYFYENHGVHEKYLISFESQSRVDDLYNSLRKLPDIKEICLNHDNIKGSFKTIMLEKDGDMLLIASAGNGVSKGFLANLRNIINQKLYENYSILFIIPNDLDTLFRGAVSFMAYGMPLHVKNIKKNLIDEINRNVKTDKDKAILKYKISNMEEDFVATSDSIFDFKKYLEIIEKKVIEIEDYKDFKLFPMTVVGDVFSDDKFQSELKESEKYYSRILKHHVYGDLSKIDENYLGDVGKKLKREKWESINFIDVKEANEKAKEKQKIEFLGVKSVEDIAHDTKLDYWDKPESDTIVGRRTRNIIIFDYGNSDNILIDLKFNKTVNFNNIKKSDSYSNIVTKGHRILLTVNKSEKKNNIFLNYKHENKTSSNYKFKVAIIPIKSISINHHKSDFSVPKLDKNDLPAIGIKVEEGLRIGTGSPVNSFFSYNSKIEYSLENKELIFDFDEDIPNENFTMTFKEKTRKFSVQCSVDSQDSKKSINGKDIFSLKLQRQESFIIENRDFVQGVNSYKTKESSLLKGINYEKLILNNNAHLLEETDGGFKAKRLRIPDSIKSSYESLITYFNKNHLVPLLTYWDEALKNLVEEHISNFKKVLTQNRNKDMTEDSIKDLLYLGAIKIDNELHFSSLNIVNLLYLNELIGKYSGIKFSPRFNDLINPNNLVPSIYYEKKLYSSKANNDLPGHIIYEINKNTNVSKSTYTNRIVKNRITEYIKHFEYIFKNELYPVIKINLINVTNVDEIADGIFNFIQGWVNKGFIEDLPSIKLCNYNNNLSEKTKFEILNSIENVDYLEKELDYTFKPNNLDKRDLVKIIREKIKYFQMSDFNELEQSDLIFTEMKSKIEESEIAFDNLETGIFCKGLMSSLALTSEKSLYRLGFGTKKLEVDTELLSITKLLNEYILNARNDFLSDFKRNQAITLTVSDNQDYNDYFDLSNWVVFLSPDVDLNYFANKFRNKVILHYSDKYTNSNSIYDAVTLTKNTGLYKSILKQHVTIVDKSEESLNELINIFNAVNGEWLLNMVNSNKNYVKEKISLLAAVKFLIAYFDNPNYLWIPISLEEVLRVSGAVGISGKGGIFSVSELDSKGKKSDDLLLIGLKKDTSDTKVTLIPVEVKSGKNSSNVLNKAIEQVHSTSKMFDDYLYSNHKNQKLERKILENFFLQMALVNYKKLLDFEIIESNDEIYYNIQKDLINDNYSLEKIDELEHGVIMSFKSEVAVTKTKRVDSSLLIELNENYIYKKAYQDSSQTLKELNNEKVKFFNEHKIVKGVINKKLSNSNEQLKSRKPMNVDSIMINNQRKILLGESKFGGEKYWNFLHDQLQNRHLLITGKSGTGKTYAIQTLLFELQKNAIPAIIFDYTEGFTKTHLEDLFKEHVKESFEEHFVKLSKLGINPFKLYDKELNGHIIYDEPNDVASRIASTLTSVYQMGPQQKASIYESVRQGIMDKGEDFNFTDLLLYLEDSENSSSKSVISKIQEFVHKDIFNSKQLLSWETIMASKKIHVIQLTGYNDKIQSLIVEFVLWDFWNFFSSNGKESNPIVVVLDEAQNISHKDDTPSAKILTEGRKFGISGWYATQFLNSAMSSDEVERLQQAAQKLYFKPTNSGINDVAKAITSDNSERKIWMKRLNKLGKGECVSEGYEEKLNSLVYSKPEIIKISPFEERVE